MNLIYNRSSTISVILDNRTTGMTGHQDNPGTGFTLQKKSVNILDIESIVRAIGFSRVRTINPFDQKAVKDALDWALKSDEPTVIITRWPCVLKAFSEEDKREFGNVFASKCRVVSSKCTACKSCLGTGCPAISFDDDALRAEIDQVQCVGCGVCEQACSGKAIARTEY